MTMTLTQMARMGGKARAKALTKAERVEIARKAGSAPKKARKAKSVRARRKSAPASS